MPRPNIKHAIIKLATFFLIIVIAFTLFTNRQKILDMLRRLRIVPDNKEKPETVVDNFYNWYQRFTGNPITSGAYQKVDYLTFDFKKKISDLIATQGYTYIENNDPVYCSKDKPYSLKAEKSQINGDKATVNLKEDLYGTTQDVPIKLVLEKNQWKINDVVCPKPLVIIPPIQKFAKVFLYFDNPSRVSQSTESVTIEGCGAVFPAQRYVREELNSPKNTLNLLFAGPTKIEVIMGYSTMFSDKTANILKDVKAVDKTAYVNLIDIRKFLSSVSASCGSKEFFTQVGETLRRNHQIEKVIYAIEGDPKTFYEWVQIGCQEENSFCDKKPFE